MKPAARDEPQTANASDRTTIADYQALAPSFHDSRAIKCVGVWDTVGSYGIPAGFGFAALARYFTLIALGFHDTSFGDHIGIGLHAVAVDEHRRPFVPTFWTIAKGRKPNGHVEQTWFAGAHSNVGGGLPDSGLSDQALVWMIARVAALTGLEFNKDAIRSGTRPSIGAAVEDSTVGWPLDHAFPLYRHVLPRTAIHHGYFFNTDDPVRERINERVHWSVLAKHESPGHPPYDPPNLPSVVTLSGKISAITVEERDLLPS